MLSLQSIIGEHDHIQVMFVAPLKAIIAAPMQAASSIKKDISGE